MKRNVLDFYLCFGFESNAELHCGLILYSVNGLYSAMSSALERKDTIIRKRKQRKVIQDRLSYSAKSSRLFKCKPSSVTFLLSRFVVR